MFRFLLCSLCARKQEEFGKCIKLKGKKKRNGLKETFG